MDGLSFVLFIEDELKKRNIPKGVFYKETGISSATMSQWRKNIYVPSSENIKKIEDYFQIKFEITQKEKPIPEGDELDAELKRLLMKLNPDEVVRATAYVQGMIANRK